MNIYIFFCCCMCSFGSSLLQHNNNNNNNNNNIACELRANSSLIRIHEFYRAATQKMKLIACNFPEY